MSDNAELEGACKLIWGRLMMKGKFLEAIQFSLIAKLLAIELNDSKFISGTEALLQKAVEEFQGDRIGVQKNEEPQCSFCQKRPPAVKLGAGAHSFICNECVETFHEIFDAGEV